MATRPKFAKMANYSCECVEASHIFLKNGLWQMSGECIESGESGWRMSGECIESDQNRLAIVGASKIGCLMTYENAENDKRKNCRKWNMSC